VPEGNALQIDKGFILNDSYRERSERTQFRFYTKKVTIKQMPLISIGTPGWIRTSGFQLRRLTLYPLSYGRTCKPLLSLYDPYGQVKPEDLNPVKNPD
jgi:hypothetical protein